MRSPPPHHPRPQRCQRRRPSAEPRLPKSSRSRCAGGPATVSRQPASRTSPPPSLAPALCFIGYSINVQAKTCDMSYHAVPCASTTPSARRPRVALPPPPRQSQSRPTATGMPTHSRRRRRRHRPVPAPSQPLGRTNTATAGNAQRSIIPQAAPTRPAWSVILPPCVAQRPVGENCQHGNTLPKKWKVKRSRSTFAGLVASAKETRASVESLSTEDWNTKC